MRRDAAQTDPAGREVDHEEDVVRDPSRPASRLKREEVALRDGSPMRLEEYRPKNAAAAVRFRPSLERKARFSAFKYSICEAACRSSQHAMLAMSKANTLAGFQDINAGYGEPTPCAKPSSRTKRGPRRSPRLTDRPPCRSIAEHSGRSRNVENLKGCATPCLCADCLRDQ